MWQKPITREDANEKKKVRVSKRRGGGEGKRRGREKVGREGVRK